MEVSATQQIILANLKLYVAEISKMTWVTDHGVNNSNCR